MRYMGGKSRIAKEISSTILEHSGNRSMYVEPFLGGGAMAEHMVKHFESALLSDSHVDLMMMWSAALNGWLPPENVSISEYKELRSDSPSAMRGFVGFGGSFGGKWFGGYAKGGYKSNGEPRNHQAESSRNVSKKAIKLSGATLICSDFRELVVPKSGAVIYCDPPYANTTSYSTDEFPHKEFWDMAEKWSMDGNAVYVSEYTAPDGWTPIWSRSIKVSTNIAANRATALEKLFVFTG